MATWWELAIPAGSAVLGAIVGTGSQLALRRGQWLTVTRLSHTPSLARRLNISAAATSSPGTGTGDGR
jgi:hypothetical protein